MKANEAPEKIFVQPNAHDGWFEHKPYSDNFVEYTRTDAFINKAVEFLSKEANLPLWEGYDGNFGCDTVLLIKNFKNYMKRE